MKYKEVDFKKSLAEIEEEILKYWQENEIFKATLENRKNSPEYSFFDGPPFATGSPHYGHIVASTMKDVVPRYFTMKGYYVPRVWGWDCHGLPIENIAEAELGIKSKKEIKQMGVEKFNNICRSKVLEYVAIWEKFIPRLGRWIDMKNAYRTMDIKYMESVWWVFKELFDKGLIYKDYRSMHICPRCETTLSQSEVAEGYRNVKDLSVVVKFELLDELNDKIVNSGRTVYILAWTTTPWTLLGNVALAINSEIEYVLIKNESNNEYYILAKDRLSLIKEKYTIIKTVSEKDLIGRHYIPLFDYYLKNPRMINEKEKWIIVDADFVSTDEGTGVVHIAPAFGEDDLNLCKSKNLAFIQHVGMDGVIKEGYGQFSGLSVKPAEDAQKTDIEIIKNLAVKNLLFSKAQYEHSYPHCWRCETPLLNYATDSYFVSVEKIKNDAIRLSEQINWLPKHVKRGRFGKWLEGAHDWSISRQRFWASVIPIWICDKCGKEIIFGSVKELEEKSKQKINDLHKDYVDKISFACDTCEGKFKRVPDVLDAWFDSGSMPYGQKHYPFENKENFENNFPAEFIGEGQDQTRCWFYYLHILSSSLMKNIAFKNVIVNGIVLSEDGKKMSKRLQNYPDPMETINKYGADALRLYLLISSVLQMENLNFKEEDLASISRGPLRMLFNSYCFFILYVNNENINISTEKPMPTNILDKWILIRLNNFIKEIDNYMQNYELVKASREIAPFINDLSNWYIRRSRKRFSKNKNEQDKKLAFNTLYFVLIELSKVLAPFLPFISEEIFKNLSGKKSVHLENYPDYDEKMKEDSLILKMNKVRSLVEIGLAQRAQKGAEYRVRQPLSKATINIELENEYKDILKDELNVKKIEFNNMQKEDILLDTIITDELKTEGQKNDLLRKIQEIRKKHNLNPSEKVIVYYNKKLIEKKLVEQYKKDIILETNLIDLIESDAQDGLWLGENK